MIFQTVENIYLIIFTGIILIIIVIFNILNLIQKSLAKERSISLINYKQIISLLFNNVLYQFISNFRLIFRRSELSEQDKIEQLLVNNTKLKTLFCCLADGAILLDSKFRVLLANPAAVVQLDWSNKSVIGKYIFDLVPKHVSNQLLPVCNDLLMKSCCSNFIQETHDLCITIQLKQVKILKFLFTVSSRQDCNCTKSIVITIQDITREIEMNITKGKLISTLAHELYNPLSNIRSFLETLYEYDNILDRLKKLEFLEIANQETIRLANLVKHMLDLSSLESQYGCITDSIDIISIIDYVMHTYQVVAQRKKVQLVLENSNRLLPVIGNYNLLIQVIGNLIGNAIKFTHTNSCIIVRAYSIDEKLENYPSVDQDLCLRKVRIEVIDEGIGIHKTLQQKIFQHFSQVDNKFNVFKGKGLGLAIVRTIVNKHNSSIYIYSESHIGSCFWFDLPIILEKDT